MNKYRYREVKNHIHNELKLTKEDIKDIIVSIVKEEVNQAINMAVEVLSSVSDNRVHGGDADCIIAEFEEKLNETING